MNIRTTIFLIVLAVSGGLAWWFVPMMLPKPPSPDGVGSLEVLDQKFAQGNLRKIEVMATDPPVVLEKDAAGNWALPGKWPTRKAEADELVSLISGLHSRFAVIPVTAGMDLKPYGLDPDTQKPVRVKVQLDEESWVDFGQPAPTPGDPFSTPTYAIVKGKPEIVRLGPDLIKILKRPREFYQRRQLFPDVERFKFASTPPPPSMPGMPPPPETGGTVAVPKLKAIALDSPLGKMKILRLGDMPKADSLFAVRSEPQLLAESWEIVEPFKDRPDPERLKSLLGAIPELWVEGFVATADAAKTGLDKPEYTLRATLPGGDTMTLFVGKVSQVRERPGQAAPPQRPGMPAMPPIPIREELRYARLDGQDQIFEIKTDKFTDLFPAATALRDDKLARFKSSDVTQIEIKQPAVAAAAPTDTAKSGGTIVLIKEKDEKRGDKWKVTQPMQANGETDKVFELLDKLSALEAHAPDVIDNPDLKKEGFAPPATGTVITLTIDEEIPGPTDEKDKVKRQRTVVYTFGKHDVMAKKVDVRVAGRERVNVIPDDVLTLADRPALTYRGRRVLDFDTANVAKIDLQREKEKISLQQTNSEWKLTSPVSAPVAVDKQKAGDLAGELSRLEVVEFVNDAPKPEDLTKAGLDKPSLSATVTFTDPTKPPQTLFIGKQREGKADYYARLSDGGIFAVKKELREALDKDSLGYRPSQLWTFTPNDITAVKIIHADSNYELKKDGFDWKIAGPFDAKASFSLMQPVLDALANPKLSGYQVHTAANLAEFGLDKPAVQIAITATEKGKDDKDVTREQTLIIGKAVEGKPEVYAKLKDDPAIFKIAEATKLNADKSALDLLDRKLLNVDSRKIAKIQRSGSANMTATKEGKNWKIEADKVSFPADGPTIDSVLKTWEFLSADKFADYGAKVDLMKYGLNPPADTVTITLEPEPGKVETHALKLGKADGSGRFAMLDTNPGVAVLPGIVVRELAKTYLDFAERSMLNFDDGDLQGFRRTMKNNDLELTKKNTWKITKPAEQPADEQSMEDWTKQVSKLRAERVAAYAPTDLKPFGLDAPEATLTFVLPDKDGKPVANVVKVGALVDPKSPNGERFAMVDGAKSVGVLNPSQVKRLLAPSLFYRDRNIVRKLSDPDKVVEERGDRVGTQKVTFTKPAGTWKMTTPLDTDAEHTDLEEFLNVLYKLRADELIADKPTPEKLKAYGLDKPEITWKFYSGDKEVLGLLIGKKDSTDQRCYAKLTNGDMVFLLDAQTTTRATAEYRKRALWTGFDAAQVEVLTLTGDGGPFTLRKVSGTWTLDGKPDAKVDAAAVEQMLGALANLKAERYVRDKDAPLDVYGLGKPKRTITAQTGMGVKQTLLLGNNEGGSKRVYAALPGNTAVFVLSETDSTKLNGDTKAFTGK